MRWLQHVAYGLGMLWALPITLPALLFGALMLMFGARARISDGALVFHHFPLGPGGAMTLGNVIYHTGKSLNEQCITYASRRDLLQKVGCVPEIVRLGDHERAHVYQYLVFGIFFLPLYFLCGGISANNPFEKAADRYAKTGRGWWPF